MAGHFSESDRYKELRVRADMYAFILRALGVTSRRAAPEAAASTMA